MPLLLDSGQDYGMVSFVPSPSLSAYSIPMSVSMKRIIEGDCMILVFSGALGSRLAVRRRNRPECTDALKWLFWR